MAQNLQSPLLIPITEQQKGIVDHTSVNTSAVPIFYCWKFEHSGEIDVMLIKQLLARHESLKTKLVKDERSTYPIQKIQDLDCIIQLAQETVSALDFITHCKQQYINNHADKIVIRIAKDEIELNHHVYLQLPSTLADVHSLITIAVQIQNSITGNSLASDDQISYSQYVSWQQETLSAIPDEIADWIQTQLKQSASSTPLPAQSKQNTSEIKYASSAFKPVRFTVFDQLKQLATHAQASLSDVWLSLFATLIHHHTDDNTTVIGHQLNGRVYDELVSTMGRIDQNCPLIISWENVKDIHTLIQSINKIRAEQLSVAEYIGRSFIKKIAQGESPYAFHHLHLPEEIKAYSDIQTIEAGTKLQLDIIETSAGQFMRWSYNEALFSEAAIELLDNILETLLQTLLVEPTPSIFDKNTLKQLLSTSNEPTNAPLKPKWETIMNGFNVHYQLAPSAIALVFERKQWTYAQLYQSSAQLAAFLIHKKDVKVGDIIAIATGRSPEVIIALLAIIKSGAAFLPIDPSQPPLRIESILNDASPKLIFVDHILPVQTPQLLLSETITAAEDLNLSTPLPEVGAQQNAYVIYTSGTTGKPKGCIVSHYNLSHYITWCTDSYFENGKAANFAWFTPLSFDLTITSIFTPLAMGKTITVINDSLDSSEALLQCFDGSNTIDTVKLTPSHIDVLKTLAIPKTKVKVVITGGEALQISQVETLVSLNREIEIYNEYGPTEATVGCIVKKINPSEDRITIGYPIHRMEAFILNTNQEVQCAGISGELYLAGDGLTKGYLYNEQLTSEKFIPASWSPDKLLYRTGDLARMLPQGEIEYLGRIDNQVKIRGYRIELAEITHHLKKISGIASAHVLVEKKENEQQLVAFYVSSTDALIADIQEQLLQHLPPYMLPVHFFRVTEIPLTTNGKIDERKLSSHDLTIKENVLAYEAPENQTEQNLAQIWKEVLNVEIVSRNDDFFHLGGQSIKAAQLVGRLKKQLKLDFQLKDIFNYPILFQQALLVSKLSTSRQDAPQILPQQLDYEASGAQLGIWTAQHFQLQSSAYNLPVAYLVHGNLNKDALVSAFELLIQQFESLRTSFKMGDEGLRQIIHPPSAFNYHFEDWSTLKIDKQRLNERCEQHAKQYIDLTAAPLYRAALYKLPENRWLFLLNMHHIIADGRSEEILFAHLKTYYQTLSTKQELPSVSTAPYQYKEFAAWQNNLQKGILQAESRTYWMNQLKGDLPKCIVKAPNKLGLNRKYQSASTLKSLGTNTSKQLQLLATKKKAGLSAVLISIVETVLYRYSGQEEWAIGIPVDNRLDEVFDDQVGLFLNTIVLRNTIRPHLPINTLLDEVREVLVEGLTHKHYPFDLLVRDLHSHDHSANKLFNVLFNLQERGAQPDFEMGELNFEKVTTHGTTTKVDLVFNFTLINGEIQLEIDYTTDFFTSEFITQLAEHLLQIATEISINPEQSIAQIPMLRTSETAQLKTFGHHTSDWKPKNETLYSAFEKIAKALPSQTALVAGNKRLNYGELNQKVEYLSRYFIHYLQIQPGEIIPVLAERNVETIIILLALQRCSAVYLPIESSYPQQRIEAILLESKASVILNATDKAFRTTVTIPVLSPLSEPIEKFDSYEPPLIQDDSSAAYMIFTSGSTGKPKGVMISHRGFMNMISDQRLGFELSGTDRCLWFSSPGFDASLSEIFLALLSGATLYLASRELIENQYHFLNWLNQEEISVATLPPAYVMALPDVDLPKLRVLISAGEAMPPALASRFASKTRLFNAYGPTENSVCTTYGEVNPDDIGAIVPIGKPISNISVKVVDKNNQLVPIGVLGELHISGVGLAEEYYQNSTQTDQFFYQHNNERWYRSGDWVQWLADGTLTYHGRKDEQIKIRGNRVELGDIKEFLLQLPTIKDAAVVYTSSLLIAYVVVRGEDEDLKLRIKAGLPDYMVPDHIISVQVIPLNINGKVDTSQLPAPIAQPIVSNKASLTSEENIVIACWRRVLKTDAITSDSNFFNLGGQSLTAIQVITDIYHKTAINISLSDIYTYPKVNELAQVIASRMLTKPAEAAPSLPRNQWTSSTPMQQKLWADMDLTDAKKYLMPGSVVLNGTLDEALFLQALSLTIDQHSALRYRFSLQQNGLAFTAVKQTAEQVVFKDLTNIANDLTLLQAVDPEKDPLCRLALVKVSENSWRFTFMLHHLIGDAWSVRLLITSVLGQYSSLLKQIDFKIPERIGYDDYATWLEKSAPITVNRKEIAATALIKDNFRPTEINETNNHNHVFQATIHQTLTELSAVYAIPYLPLISGFTMLTLMQHTQQETLSILTPLHGHYDGRWNETIGLFMNIVPFTISADPQKMVHELLTEIQQQYIGFIDPRNGASFSAQWVPTASELKDRALVEIQLDDSDLQTNNEYDLQGLTVAHDEDGDRFMVRKFDLEFHYRLRKDELSVDCLFDADSFSLPILMQRLHRFEKMLLLVKEQPYLTVSDLFAGLNANEKKKIQTEQSASIRNFFKKN